MEPELSIIIPTFNRRALVVETVQRLSEQTYPHEAFEVIIAIDGSQDGSEEALRKLELPFRLIVLQQPNKGPSAARNLGASKASGKFLLFLDDDILASPELVSEHLSFHQRFPDSVVVGPTPMDQHNAISGMTLWQRQSYESDIARLNSWGFNAIDPYFCLGANGSLSKDLFVRSGGFDEALHSEGDEFELGLRLLDSGATFRWNPRAVGHQVWVRDDLNFCVTGRQRRALNELKILKTEPRFRLLSHIGELFTGPRLRILRRRMIATFPELTEFFSKVALRLVKVLPTKARSRLEIIALKGISSSNFWKSLKLELGTPLKMAEMFNAKVPILMYHLIRDDLPSCDVVMSIKKFDRQMTYLHEKGYQCIGLTDWRDWVLYGKPLPAKPVILTFDDGFEDLYQNAWPILRRYNFGFTVFLVTRRIGEVNSWDGIEPGKLKLLTREQIQEMAVLGASFQSHSRTHPVLTSIDNDRLVEEITMCKSDLEKVVGETPKFFAYPYGNFGPRERKAVYEAGYLGACTTLQGTNSIRTDLYRLKRVNISGKDTMLDFYFKLRFGSGFVSFQNLKNSIKLLLRQELGVRIRGTNFEYLV